MKNYHIENWEIYTDGSCRKILNTDHSGFAAWGYLIRQGNDTIKVFVDGTDGPTSTNQQAELLAILRALEYTKEHRPPNTQTFIYSDSAYAIKGITEWLPNWKKQGWVNSKKKPVENIELWQELDKYVNMADVFFVKVKGHEDNVWNNEVDKLVQDFSSVKKDTWRGFENE